MPDLPTMTLIWITVALVVGLAIEVLSFWAGCILTDAPSPGYGITFALAVPLYFVWALALLWVLVTVGGMFTSAVKNPWSTQTIILVVIASLLANIILATLVYPMLLSISLKKGVFVALIEVLLRSLLGALIIGLVLVVLAIYQVSLPRADEPRTSSDCGTRIADCRTELVPFALLRENGTSSVLQSADGTSSVLQSANGTSSVLHSAIRVPHSAIQ